MRGGSFGAAAHCAKTFRSSPRRELRVMCRSRSDTGAVAVEFAIVLVPLLLLLMGIVDFGRVYSEQLSLTAAAREGARVMAVQNSPANARSATIAALSPSVAGAQIGISPSSCSTGVTVTVTVTYPASSMTGMFDALLNGKNLIGTGVMRCGG